MASAQSSCAVLQPIVVPGPSEDTGTFGTNAVLRMYASRRRRRCFLKATNLLQPGGAARQGRSPERGRQLLLFHAHVRSFTMLSGAADIGCKIPRGSIHATDSRRFGRGLHLPGAKLVSCLKQQEKGCRRTPDADCGRV